MNLNLFALYELVDIFAPPVGGPLGMVTNKSIHMLIGSYKADIVRIENKKKDAKDLLEIVKEDFDLLDCEPSKSGALQRVITNLKRAHQIYCQIKDENDAIMTGLYLSTSYYLLGLLEEKMPGVEIFHSIWEKVPVNLSAFEIDNFVVDDYLDKVSNYNGAGTYISKFLPKNDYEILVKKRKIAILESSISNLDRRRLFGDKQTQMKATLLKFELITKKDRLCGEKALFDKEPEEVTFKDVWRMIRPW